jgi:hypothetical protein
MQATEVLEIVRIAHSKDKCPDLRGADLWGADLQGANLSDADLQGANLCDANLQGANLCGAYLWGADLRGANLQGADLSGASLWGADLRGANLQGADMRGADLGRANLGRADLGHADMRGADLGRADLGHADMRGADLGRANLGRADMRDANLTGTCLDPANTVPTLTDEEIAAAGLIVDGDLVRGWRTSVSQVCGNTSYEPGSHHVAPWFSIDSETPYHPGIYLASQEWLASNHPGASIVPCHCLRSELVHAGDKFRTKQIWIEG